MVQHKHPRAGFDVHHGSIFGPGSIIDNLDSAVGLHFNVRLDSAVRLDFDVTISNDTLLLTFREIPKVV